MDPLWEVRHLPGDQIMTQIMNLLLAMLGGRTASKSAQKCTALPRAAACSRCGSPTW
jgi:hypothetical protein